MHRGTHNRRLDSPLAGRSCGPLSAIALSLLARGRPIVPTLVRSRKRSASRRAAGSLPGTGLRRSNLGTRPGDLGRWEALKGLLWQLQGRSRVEQGHLAPASWLVGLANAPASHEISEPHVVSRNFAGSCSASSLIDYHLSQTASKLAVRQQPAARCTLRRPLRKAHHARDKAGQRSREGPQGLTRPKERGLPTRDPQFCAGLLPSRPLDVATVQLPHTAARLRPDSSAPPLC